MLRMLEPCLVARLWLGFVLVFSLGFQWSWCLLTTRPVEPASTMDAMLEICSGVEVDLGVYIDIFV